MTVIIDAFMKMCVFSGPLVISINNHQAVSSFFFFRQKISIIIQVAVFFLLSSLDLFFTS